MSRIIAGPFNRVEGDLEVALTIEDGEVLRAEVTTTLYRGFEQILIGRPALDSLVIAPRICGICSVSQSVAAATALRRLGPLEAAPNGLYATAIAHAAENIADHLTHFHLFFMPDFARADYAGRPWHDRAVRRFKAGKGEAQAMFLPARRRLMETMGLIAGKWPHSLAFQPGGLTRTLSIGDRVQLISLINEFRVFAESTLFGAPLDEIIALESCEALEDLVRGEARTSDLALFLAIAEDLALDRIGLGPGLLMSHGAYDLPEGQAFPAGLVTAKGETTALDPSAIIEDVSHAWMAETAGDPFGATTLPDAFKDGAYSWAKAPRLSGEPVEVGALARQAVAGHPLILDCLRRDGGSSVKSRIIARLVETAMLIHAATGWLKALRLREPFLNPDPLPRSGQAVGRVEAARGSLAHYLTVEDGEIRGYQIIAPTTWNFSPRDKNGRPGPLEQALAGLRIGPRGADDPMIQHVVRSFDPCMVCTAH